MLVHEKVVGASDADLSSFTADPENHVFKRLGFCDRAARNYRLGCAHTMANARFNWLIDQLVKRNLVTGLLALQQEVDELVGRIYLLDHRKGDLEKQMAVAALSGDRQQLDRLTGELDELKAFHSGMIDRLESLRELILNEIDGSIAGRSPSTVSN
ncbi:ABC transporter C-terminal domain-containing protein [Hufsiella ginkgonis]|uniref:Uncharacterized protein n=1 Tax=Hufsiella ginkgonis TaxID=2695274 RepID=A0A7K1Y1P7_9SPHI|nr:ABC transporter C-terminal domain-containing protein [Hufsiella ginkgonis]MXV17047.1 hypothetical protein [Hufsiella ginkgonis]